MTGTVTSVFSHSSTRIRPGPEPCTRMVNVST